MSYYLLPKDAKAKLAAHTYKGSDLSLTYKYILSPFAQWIVDHILPSWLAPNLITLIGALCVFLPCMFFLAYPDQPGYIYAIYTISHLTY